MLGLFKSKSTSTAAAENPGLFARLKNSLKKTRTSLSNGLANVFLGKKAIDEQVLEELQTQLLLADIGVAVTEQLLARLTTRIARKQLDDTEALLLALKEEMTSMLQKAQAPLLIDQHTPFVILMVGINGAGKTTTIGKLAKQFKQNGKKVLLAAGDTFRAAAIEQLQVWGERNQIPVIAQHSGADSASVIFDALQAAKARGMDLLLADTAGRLHTQNNLMEELKKIKRVIKKLEDSAPHETLLILDASLGQNSLTQAQQFHEAIGITGLCITKLDGTAKGGIVFNIVDKLGLPIRYIGLGEGIDDLKPFDAETYVEALFADDDSA